MFLILLGKCSYILFMFILRELLWLTVRQVKVKKVVVPVL